MDRYNITNAIILSAYIIMVVYLKRETITLPEVIVLIVALLIGILLYSITASKSGD